MEGLGGDGDRRVSFGCGWRAGQGPEPIGRVRNDGFSLAVFLLPSVDGSTREEERGGSEPQTTQPPGSTAFSGHRPRDGRVRVRTAWLADATREGSRVTTPHNRGGEAPSARSWLAEIPLLALHPSLQMLAVHLEARVLPAALLRAGLASSGRRG